MHVHTHTYKIHIDLYKMLFFYNIESNCYFSLKWSFLLAYGDVKCVSFHPHPFIYTYIY